MFVHANGVKLHVRRLPDPPRPQEDRPAVVFVHGLSDSLASFYFTLVSPVVDAGFDVITYDLRGHGRSGRPPTGYGIDDGIADLAALLTGLGVTRPVHLVGYSLGGTIGYGFARRFPERVATLVALEAEPATEHWARRTAAGFDEVAEHLAREGGLVAEHPLIERAAAVARRLSEETTARTDLLAPASWLTGDQIAGITMPVLLVVGGISGLSARLDEFTGLLPDLTVRVIAGQEHMLLVHSPREVAETVVPWLEKHGR
ncbi:alpha/beta fold hydrolase [Streptomyces sp. NPDC093094]|uniref:alpha/beta fold hydrolase n=1 Tax=Streptomyces sp. NPDC093094 TaxID=3366026 RepID=UPI0037F3C024